MIDIRELRIGSSVLLCGNRVKVTELSQEHIAVGNYVEREGSKFPIGYTPDQIDPIPITEELLTELGFGVTGRYSNEFIHYIDKFGLFVKHVNGTNRFRLTIEDEDGIAYGNILCRYLHELQQFVYLTTKQELK